MSQFRNVALVGPYSSGKTTVLESLLYTSGAITRKGSIKDGNTLGDSSTEARDRKMSTEVTAASFEHGGLSFSVVDCPGSIEFLQEALNVLVGVDAAIVVCEPDIQKVLSLAPIFQRLDEWEIPHFVFINKMDQARENWKDVLSSLNQVSSRPLVMRQYPIFEAETISGFIDLVSEQAYHYHPGAPADLIPLPKSLKEVEASARMEMLETLSEFDDHLLEELVEEILPSEAEVRHDFQMELGADLIVPVLFGVAEQTFGIQALLATLVEDVPDATATAMRRGFKSESEAVIAQVLKTFITPQGGKQSLVRIWQGQLEDGMILNDHRVGGIYRLFGQQAKSLGSVEAGDIVAVNRLEGVRTGDILSQQTVNSNLYLKAPVLEAVFCRAIKAVNRKDEVKMSTALSKIHDEDPSIVWKNRESTHEILLWGQGDIHIQVALDRLMHKHRLPIRTHEPHIPYQESIRRAASSHGRYKHQTGGHGQFGDVYLDIQPKSRGEGVEFSHRIVGGVVPRQYIPGVETGVREYLSHGPHGFPIVDISVTLTDGSYHSVDSSEQAFKQAARLAMQEGLRNCEPILLEPVESVEISAPAEFTSNVLRLITNRRGQILGYEAKRNWQGWDVVSAHMPMAEMQDLIIELRSLTQGVGFFHW
ncbi:MAG: elongation factor G, partial [Cyanobacteria bacterium P01_F01_bin.42]